MSNVESDLEEEEDEYDEEEEESEEDDSTNEHTSYSHQRKCDQFMFII